MRFQQEDLREKGKEIVAVSLREMELAHEKEEKERVRWYENEQQEKERRFKEAQAQKERDFKQEQAEKERELAETRDKREFLKSCLISDKPMEHIKALWELFK